MIGNNKAPSLNRRFAAEDWPFLDARVFPKAREQARDEERHDRLPIFGYDIDERSVAVARRHAEKAGVEVHWEVRPVQKLKTDYEKGLLLCNPPYGERMLTGKEAADLYRDMRRVFDTLPGWHIGVISGMDNFEKVYGKRADKRRKLSNGGLPCTFYQYFPERTPERKNPLNGDQPYGA
jgi:putative N6-adenine-specific DNA methylase